MAESYITRTYNPISTVVGIFISIVNNGHNRLIIMKGFSQNSLLWKNYLSALTETPFINYK